MSLEIVTSDDRKWRVISDSLNQRLYLEQYQCACGEWVNAEDVLWALPTGERAEPESVGAAPYCDDCVPEEDDSD
jgi:hypothetical protein